MDIYEQIVELRRSGRRGAVATIVNVRGSIPSFRTAKMLVRDDGSIVGTIGGGCVEADVWQAAREVMESEKPRTLKFDLNQDPRYDTGLVCGGTLEIFVEPILPPALLYLFGAGHVALNLCQVAATAGFEVTVTDDRSSYATKERFPAAREMSSRYSRRCGKKACRPICSIAFTLRSGSTLAPSRRKRSLSPSRLS
jgi:xanthine dehydrogenase accessory factor